MIRIVWMALLILGMSAIAQPVLRKGISVEMAATTSAVPMAEADQADSLIVAVSRNGTVYLEATPLSPAALTEEVGRVLSGHAVKKVFVKADARTPFANVAIVLDALRKAGAVAANLLTSQRDPADGRNAPPKGLEVWLGAPSLQGSAEKAVALEAAGPLLFGDVVRLIDASHSTGARVFLK